VQSARALLGFDGLPSRGASANIGIVILVEIAPIPVAGDLVRWSVKVGVGVDGNRIPIPIRANIPPPTVPVSSHSLPPMASAP
jgi:hypothetical protein